METTTVDSLASVLSPEVPAPALSILDLAFKGGWVMIILLLLSLLAAYIFVTKLMQIRSAGKDDKYFMERIKDYISEGKTSSALKLCDDTDSPAARMVKKGISRLGRPMSDILVIVENVGNIEIGRLEKGMPVLATIAAGAPMIGFLGTVTGMVRAFFDMANAGGAGVDVALLSGGIYEALVTTVGGLVVGIITLFAYNYLVAELDKVINKMETKTVEFMDLLNDSL
ncbi:MotA/TolQ/ExbB proton channel family protein [Porphyromonas sp. COT-290 OH3588]|uniref:MotA/TolQ/ExbB proton channel family protein n=1 Tax=Porphyromonas sp. COT-290 OH3588 TaxID=1515617 RepID=UPI00052C65BC|nr:MotA/TolQ/ExbB proton channel family protein [Porphyromonas sp. COT-290 OH3588]KGN97847.1 biopolymer transporter ExbB [Porphyromonas sp. COT-290 OH3588]MDO4692580.1 MotA/TolQ/ExbB proton channel family protein [Porphyromonadaceae bacterium]